MNHQFTLYYVSRAALSILSSIIVLGLSWAAAVLAAILFGFFILYLHSGWFQVDPSNRFFPLRRDDRGREIQRKALIAAVIVGTLLFVVLSLYPLSVPAAPVALALSIAVYFGSQFLMFAAA